jgi:UDP-N-acetylglucosamine transferase subunit ALG13
VIFVTVGTQLPFDRLIRVIDGWAKATGQTNVFAQIGPTDYQPRHLQWSKFIDAQEFRRHVAEADVVVAHAGMGSIITALELGKPIIVMPRSAALGEHRNDHQLATAKRFLAQGRIFVAFDENHLVEKLDQVGTFKATERISSQASPRLLAAIRSFIHTGQHPIASSALKTNSAADINAVEFLPTDGSVEFKSSSAIIPDNNVRP